MHLSECVAVVLGGAGGIGKEYCRALLQKGARVCCGDIQAERGRLVEIDFVRDFNEDYFFFAPCDATKEIEITELFERAENRYGRVDVFVNACVMISEKEWKKTLEVNVIGAVRAVHVALSHMGKDEKGRGGVIVLTSSFYAFQPCLACPTYGAACGMLLSYVKSWAHPSHFARTGVRFNALCPGSVNTHLWGRTLSKDDNVLEPEQAEEELHTREKVTLGQCAAGMLTLLENDEHNGDVMIVSAKKGTFLDTSHRQYEDLQ